MFDPFRTASTAGKVSTVLILLFLFLSWVSTMVTFGSVLHNINVTLLDGSYRTLDFYWDHAHYNGPDGSANYKYNSGDLRSEDGDVDLSSCKGGGDGTLAFAIFAFLAFLIHIPLALSRVAGLSFPLARDTQHSLYIELVLSCVEFFCFFLTTCIWGGSCLSPSRSATDYNVSLKGFGLMIACLFFLFINTILYFLMRSNENLVVGTGASRAGGSSYGGGGGGEYSSGGDGGEASQPTFSYQANASDNTM